MKRIIIPFILLAFNANANEELNKFLSEKSKQIDSLSVVFSEDLLKAQKQYEKAVSDADKKYSKELEKLEKKQQEFTEKYMELPNIVEPKNKKK